MLIKPIVPLSGRQVLPALMIGFMGNNVLPAHLGEFMRVVVLARQHKTPPMAVLSTVVLERFFDMIALLTILLFGLLSLKQLSPAMQTTVIIFAAVVCSVTVALALFLTFTRLFISIFEWVLKRIPGVPETLIQKVHELLLSAETGLKSLRDPKLIALILANSFLQWLLGVLMIAISIWSFDLPVSFLGAAVVMGVTAFAVMVPASPGFFGVIQASFWFALQLFGVSQADAFAASIYYHLTQYIPITLVGLIFLNRTGMSLLQLEQAAEETQHQTEPEAESEQPKPAESLTSDQQQPPEVGN